MLEAERVLTRETEEGAKVQEQDASVITVKDTSVSIMGSLAG
jgi:hypothetical protein